jgi:hypothetical protein
MIIWSSLDMFANISENVINYTFNVSVASVFVSSKVLIMLCTVVSYQTNEFM